MKLAEWTPSYTDSLRTISVLQMTIQALHEIHETGDAIASKIARQILNTEVGP